MPVTSTSIYGDHGLIDRQSCQQIQMFLLQHETKHIECAILFIRLSKMYCCSPTKENSQKGPVQVEEIKNLWYNFHVYLEEGDLNDC